MRKEPPPKETALQMARYYCENNLGDEKMWIWLFVWGWYEHYVKEYYD